MREADVLILGAGVAGLTCRALLPSAREATTLESAPEPGGLIRVHRHGDVVFDTVVHVLSFRDRQLDAWVRQLLGGRIRSFRKRNAVWQQGRRIDYPYQFSAGQLPAEIRDECLAKFEDNPHAGALGDGSFRDWLLAQFGPGFYRHFFEPYNRKLYGVCPSQLEAAPMVWTIPADNQREVRAGAERRHAAEIPGAEVYYPTGPRGIARLADALEAVGEGPLLCNRAAVEIDWRRRRVRTSSEQWLRYTDLVSTLSLPVLIRLLRDVPSAVREAAAGLRMQPVTVVQIFSSAPGPALPEHWCYFPDAEQPFYRATRLETIAPDMVPAGGCALLLECPGAVAPPRSQLLRCLVDLGYLQHADVEHCATLHLPAAYVLFLRGYRERLARIERFLAEIGIRSCGRYGDWAYANIEGTLRSGMRAVASFQEDTACGVA